MCSIVCINFMDDSVVCNPVGYRLLLYLFYDLIIDFDIRLFRFILLLHVNEKLIVINVKLLTAVEIWLYFLGLDLLFGVLLIIIVLLLWFSGHFFNDLILDFLNKRFLFFSPFLFLFFQTLFNSGCVESMFVLFVVVLIFNGTIWIDNIFLNIHAILDATQETAIVDVALQTLLDLPCFVFVFIWSPWLPFEDHVAIRVRLIVFPALLLIYSLIYIFLIHFVELLNKSIQFFLIT